MCGWDKALAYCNRAMAEASSCSKVGALLNVRVKSNLVTVNYLPVESVPADHRR